MVVDVSTRFQIVVNDALPAFPKENEISLCVYSRIIYTKIAEMKASDSLFCPRQRNRARVRAPRGPKKGKVLSEYANSTQLRNPTGNIIFVDFRVCIRGEIRVQIKLVLSLIIPL